jgi:predicted nucleotide-binding protein (sugar kinase/HSP70/actin superfamily)
MYYSAHAYNKNIRKIPQYIDRMPINYEKNNPQVKWTKMTYLQWTNKPVSFAEC